MYSMPNSEMLWRLDRGTEPLQLPKRPAAFLQTKENCGLVSILLWNRNWSTSKSRAGHRTVRPVGSEGAASLNIKMFVTRTNF